MSIATLSSTVSSNFMYMNQGTLYMVSASYSATCHSGIHLLSQYYCGTDSRCDFHYESRAFDFGWMTENSNEIWIVNHSKFKGAKCIFEYLLCFQIVEIGIVATLDLCLTFAECGFTTNVLWIMIVVIACVWLHNKSQSESMYKVACLLQCVVLQENQVIVQTGMWSLLVVA